jgi:hypothetical protein
MLLRDKIINTINIAVFSKKITYTNIKGRSSFDFKNFKKSNPTLKQLLRMKEISSKRYLEYVNKMRSLSINRSYDAWKKENITVTDIGLTSEETANTMKHFNDIFKEAFQVGDNH